jgi:hypothetical protein
MRAPAGGATVGSRGKPDASATEQLAVEIKWLDGRLPGSILKTPPELSQSEHDIAKQVQEILRRPELAPFLSILEQYNRTPKINPGRRLPALGPPFLLGPHLFQVLGSVELQHQVRAKLPVLDQPAAEVRAHLKDVSTKSRALASARP